MNMVVIVDAEFRGEIENRLAARRALPPVAADPVRGRAGPRASSTRGRRSAPTTRRKSGAISVGRERVELLIGERHLPKLDTIVDPLVVSDLATMVWAPHGHRRGGRRAAPAGPDRADRLAGRARRATPRSTRADDLSDDTYVVDLAWLRSTPWRERVAAAFDSPRRRPELRRDLGRDRAPPRGLARRRRCCSAAGCPRGWAGSRARSSHGARALERPRAHAPAGHQDHAASRSSMSSPGLAGVTIELASGAAVSLDRAPGRAAARCAASATAPSARGPCMGASRGEGGILGEGVRQALLRDPDVSSRACARPRRWWCRAWRSACEENPAAVVAEMLVEAARARRAHRAHRRLDAQAGLRDGVARRARTGAARRSGSATSAACRPDERALELHGWPNDALLGRLSNGSARPHGACGWRASSGRRPARRPTRRSCASSSAATRAGTSCCSGSGRTRTCASLFPGKPEVEERQRLVVGVRARGHGAAGAAHLADAAGAERARAGSSSWSPARTRRRR